MSSDGTILVPKVTPSNVDNASAGDIVIFVGTDGVLRSKDESGNITVYATGISPEEVQDIIGSTLVDSASIDFNYDDPTNTITATVIQSAVDHGSISGLSDDDHPQYLNESRGDTRYYTKTQLDAGQLDSRYYTESEVNASLALKINNTEKGAANGVATLDAAIKVPLAQIPTGIDHTSLSNIGSNTHTQIDSHIASTSNPHSVTKAQVGLSNVDNTSDANKPISTATQTALNGKENLITAGTTAQYFRGDKTFQTLDKTAVGLANVDNTSDADKPISTATQNALNNKENLITAGTTSQYFRGDKTFQTLDKNSVGLNNVDNTSDANKPISTATQTALNAKLNSSEKGVANGVATLDATVKIPVAQIPALPYAPTSHTHTASQITDFTTAVQAVGDVRYSELGHTHPNATTTVAGFMSPTDKTKLDGLTNAVYLKSISTLSNSSNTIFTNLTELQFNCIVGKVYKFRFIIRYTAAATTTGLVLSMNGTADGALNFVAITPITTTTTSILRGVAKGGILTNASTPSSLNVELSIIEGVFVCTTAGVLYPQFRSEVNGSAVVVQPNSITEFNEL